MIEFEHKLPAMNINGRHNGTYNNREIGFPSVLTTTDYKLGEFLHTLRSNIYADRALVLIDGKVLMCNKNWIRDHVHVMKGMKYFEYDLASFLNFIIDTQREDGQFYELIKQYDDYHWKMVNEDCRIMYPDDNLTLVRLELEADIEYLVVEGAMYLYQITGDNNWLRSVLPKLEKGINYITSDAKRWDKKHGLVKRPFTIDTWDFTYLERSGDDRRIHDDEPMSIMHGDNSGVYQAMKQLAWFNNRLGNSDKAKQWENRAEMLRENIMKYLWNGSFFIHQLHLNHDGIDNLENERLSLSNPYDINRGLTSVEESRNIIKEYMKRKETTNMFAEWFSIDPPYKDFKSYKEGQYVNGAISPFTAGELAKAAFNNGYEEYGWDIVSRFIKLVERDNNIFFLYYPDSRPQPEGGPSCWGAAAFISAVDEGLAGIKNTGVNYDEIEFSPKFPVTHYTELRYITGYELSHTLVDVRYILKEYGMRYDIISPAKKMSVRILLPKNKKASALLINGVETDFDIYTIGESEYVSFSVAECQENMSFEIHFD
ncbi:MAG: trehalase family glycosidase [Acutalibacteraceae bacterium]|nr:trehalase family glycosidase [Acutalibacteraceae bacterium]